jgi:prevent-host-death family protein
MRYSEQIKSISFFKDNTAKIADQLRETGEPLIITQNGEASFVVQDIRSYEDTQQTFALLKLLAMGKQQIQDGKFSSAEDVFAELDAEDE